MDKVKSATLDVFLNWRLGAVVMFVAPSGALLIRSALCDGAPVALAWLFAWIVCIIRVECVGDTGSD